MPASIEPNSGLSYGWDLGESPWNTGMDGNLLLIGRAMQLAVIDRDLTAPPGSPSEGDLYIVPAGATGDWAGHATQVAVYTNSAWGFHSPKEGWIAYIKDEAKISAYKTATGWSAGLAI